ncbi:MAG TPA: EcsC family protein [Bryobacteraceae bacterium]|nr:EcsC family protein [Bryobacteraceae bacterium]
MRLALEDQRKLWKAVTILERESFVARLSELTGEPVTQILRRLPGPLNRQIHSVVRGVLSKALDVALYKSNSRFPEPGASLFKVMSGVTGGVSGFFGLATVAVELPLTTTLMLRSIAGIARSHGEDLNQPASRLACLEVLALGPRRDSKKEPGFETSYLATRTFLAKAVSESAQAMAQRGVTQTSAPVIVELLTAVGSRFGVIVSEKVAAGTIPVVGAIGGAAINLAFMEHFQQLARAHFTIRALERRYGAPEVLRYYHAYVPMVKERLAKSR